MKATNVSMLSSHNKPVSGFLLHKQILLLLVTCLFVGCKYDDVLISSETLGSTPFITVSDSGRIFVAADTGLYELLDGAESEDPRIELITAGPSGEVCHFYAIKLFENRLYATCGLYSENTAETPPENAIVSQPGNIAIFEITLNESCDQCETSPYSVKSVVLPYASIPRNIDVLAPGELIVSLALDAANPIAFKLYKISFADNDNSEILEITSIEPWFEKGFAHGFLFHEDSIYHTLDLGLSLKVSPVENGQIGKQTHFFRPQMIPFANVIANVGLFEGKLVVTQESFYAPILGSNKVFLIDIENNPGEVLQSFVLRHDVVAVDAIFKRINDELYLYYVSHNQGGIYKRLIEETGE